MHTPFLVSLVIPSGRILEVFPNSSSIRHSLGVTLTSGFPILFSCCFVFWGECGFHFWVFVYSPECVYCAQFVHLVDRSPSMDWKIHPRIFYIREWTWCPFMSPSVIRTESGPVTSLTSSLSQDRRDFFYYFFSNNVVLVMSRYSYLPLCRGKGQTSSVSIVRNTVSRIEGHLFHRKVLSRHRSLISWISDWQEE
jgi:hypothetical protein